LQLIFPAQKNICDERWANVPETAIAEAFRFQQLEANRPGLQ
jgi:hypothetical protein